MTLTEAAKTAILTRKNIWKSETTGEIFGTHHEAVNHFREGNNIRVYYEHNPSNYLIWTVEEQPPAGHIKINDGGNQK